MSIDLRINFSRNMNIRVDPSLHNYKQPHGQTQFSVILDLIYVPGQTIFEYAIFSNNLNV